MVCRLQQLFEVSPSVSEVRGGVEIGITGESVED
ncbi:MAG: hypothetical protein ACI8XM_000694, partial [Haloarculaceae archaeon]